MTDVIPFILNTTYEDLPQPVVQDAVRALVDTLGVGMSAVQTDLSRIIQAHAQVMFGGQAAQIWPTGKTASAAGAALANGMTIDALDAHDGHKLTKGHVGCGVIPAVIAMAQAEGLTDAREFLTLVTIGYEIGTRAGIALHRSACDYHTSGAWVALAAAAMGARILGLDTARTREALGIAEYHGPRSQMMRTIDAPTMVKDGSGWGAMAGVSAAYLARDGFTGAPAISVEAEDLSDIWGDIGQSWYIQDQYIKLYPVCRWAQPAAEAVMALHRAHEFNASDITSIQIESFHEAKRLNAIPTTTEQAQYSLPFSVGAALVAGTIGVDEVMEPGLGNPAILRLARMVEIEETDAFNAAFPARRFAQAHIGLADGRTLTSDITEAQGDPEARVGHAVIREKFLRLTEPVMGTDKAHALLTNIEALPNGGDLRSMMAQLSYEDFPAKILMKQTSS
ncbi:MmgE/PrpD family protein [Ruegeria sp.]|uniref:MmgE/PrpD family protein n=1 Tax=Ruegeria sp. TaxID=1879320 RepID=UPI00232322D2|nr:MmgE/PrpD family protein [Ruegeria sp.]MDA7965796.1 MmgE/PrpD family protein [Ruegeria sp.]